MPPTSIDDVNLASVGVFFCLTAFFVYVFLLLHHHAGSVRRNSKKKKLESQALPDGSLPATQLPIRRILASMLVRRIANTKLTQPFYDRELADTSRYYLIHPMPRSSVCGKGAHVVFIAHASRSATTLLCRMVEARGDVSTFKEPSVLMRLLMDASRMPNPDECNALALARSLLQYFVQHSKSHGHQATIVKLPSSASRPDVLALLLQACPTARRVAVQRRSTDIMRSLQVTPPWREPAVDFNEVLRSIHQKKQAVDTWAEHFITFDEIVHNLNAHTNVCSALGLSTPSQEQKSLMLLELRKDAKTGTA